MGRKLRQKALPGILEKQSDGEQPAAIGKGSGTSVTATYTVPGQENLGKSGPKKIKSCYTIILLLLLAKSQPRANVPAVERRPLGTVVVLQACALHQRSYCPPVVGDSVPQDTEVHRLCRWIPGQLHRLSASSSL